MSILVHKDNEQFGPFELEELTRYVQAGNFLQTDYCWQEGWSDWLPIHTLISVPAPDPPSFLLTKIQRAMSNPVQESRFPKRRLSLYSASIGIVLILLYFASPYWSLHSMKRAVDRNDAVFVADCVDFPRLRESFKGVVMANLATEVTKDETDGIGALGAALGAMMVGPMVDALVTPEGLIQMMQGRDVGSIMGGDGETTQVDSPQLGAERIESGEGDKGMDVLSMGYETLNRFAVTVAGAVDTSTLERKSITILFSRRGLMTWQLSGIRLGVD